MTNRDKMKPALLLVAHATATDELLARAATIDAFFQNATAPDTWTVRSHSDLTGPIAEIYDKAKRVSGRTSRAGASSSRPEAGTGCRTRTGRRRFVFRALVP